MKVLLVANTDWYLFRFRLALARQLRASGHEVVLVSPPGEFVASLQEEGFRWVAWDVSRRGMDPWREAAAVNALTQIYKRERPALVHHHTLKPILYGSIAARRAQVPHVIDSVAGRGYLFLSASLRARLVRPLLSTVFRWALSERADLVTFENEDDLRLFLDKRWVREGKARLISGVGVDTGYFVPLPEPDGVPVALLVGRMLWDKGVETFVEAAKILKPGGGIRFALVGGPDPGNPSSIPEEALIHWAESGLVEWWRWQQDVRKAYAACHLVVLPSRGEGLPVSLVEAAACARPLVATDVPGCRDVVADGVNGYLVPVDDAAALAAAIEKLADDGPSRKEMGKASRRLAEEKFDVQLINRDVLNLYEQVLEP